MSLNYAALKSRASKRVEQKWTASQTILYALGLGATELDFVYEKALRALPTMPGVLAGEGFFLAEPVYNVDIRKMLHVSQSVELHAPIPVAGCFSAENTIGAVVSKGEHALVEMARRVYDAKGTHFASVVQTVMLRGAGGFTGDEAPPAPPAVPERVADVEIEFPTVKSQALLYRLSGDLNPLHIDPELAQIAGFDRPILHGMCSYGIAGRAIIAALCDNDPAGLAAISCRFSAPVYPGATLRTEIWHGETVQFRALAAGRVVLSHGVARLA